MTTPRLELGNFVPFRLNRLAAEVSAELATVYADRFGVDIVEWRILATLAAHQPCSAQRIVRSTRTHKSRISRGVSRLVDAGHVARASGGGDGREALLRLTAAGKRLHRRMVEPVLAQERKILACLDADELRAFTDALDKLERSLGLVQNPDEAHD